MATRWKILDEGLSGGDMSRIQELSTLLGIDPLIAKLAYLRGHRTPLEIHDYLHSPLSLMHSPFAMSGMEEGVDRFKRAVRDKEKIGIFADSDLDGITSLTVLYKFLSMFGVEPMYRCLKNDETYGLTTDMVDEFISSKVALLITVDSGIRDIREIEYARSKNIDVIVTDHHEPDEVLPDAIVLNPKQENCSYPYRDLAGVGVVFKFCIGTLFSYLPTYNRDVHLVQAGAGGYKTATIVNGIPRSRVEYPGKKGFLEFIEKADPRDMFILYGEYDIPATGNCGPSIYSLQVLAGKTSSPGEDFLDDLCRELSINSSLFQDTLDVLIRVFFGLQLHGSEKMMRFIHEALPLVSIGSIADVMPMTGENRLLVRTGMEMLRRSDHRGLQSILQGGTLNTKDISWNIAPLLNTPGRFGRTELTVDFFLRNEPLQISETVRQIKSLNSSRKELVKSVIAEIRAGIEKGRISSAGNIIFIMRDDIPDGLSGLIANRLVDETGKPVIVFSMSEDSGLVKGSGRAPGDNEFFSRVQEYSHLFDRFGGHEQAFGFTIEHDNIEPLKRSLEKSGLPAVTDHEETADMVLDISQVSTGLADTLSILEPFGRDNREPVFVSKKIRAASFNRFGDGSHGKYSIDTGRGPVYAVGWKKADVMEKMHGNGGLMDLYYTIEKNEFRGITEPRMVIVELRDSLT